MPGIVTRLPIRLVPDPRRAITRLFLPGEENRIRDIIQRLYSFSSGEVETMLAQLKSNFQHLHPDIDEVFIEHFEIVQRYIPSGVEVNAQMRMLIGACFTMEYAIESAALFNPSMVPALDQSSLPAGSVRFVMSLRATGEGHISSIVFRRGVVDTAGRVSVDPPGQYTRTLHPILRDDFDKDHLIREMR